MVGCDALALIVSGSSEPRRVCVTCCTQRESDFWLVTFLDNGGVTSVFHLFHNPLVILSSSDFSFTVRLPSVFLSLLLLHHYFRIFSIFFFYSIFFFVVFRLGFSICFSPVEALCREKHWANAKSKQTNNSESVVFLGGTQATPSSSSPLHVNAVYVSCENKCASNHDQVIHCCREIFFGYTNISIKCTCRFIFNQSPQHPIPSHTHSAPHLLVRSTHRSYWSHTYHVHYYCEHGGWMPMARNGAAAQHFHQTSCENNIRIQKRNYSRVNPIAYVDGRNDIAVCAWWPWPWLPAPCVRCEWSLDPMHSHLKPKRMF